MSPQTRIASPLEGRLGTILVKEGEQVNKGQLLVELDASELEGRIRQAEATVNKSRAQHRLLQETGVDPTVQSMVTRAEKDYMLARHQVDRAKAELQQATIERRKKMSFANRVKPLLRNGAISDAEWEQIAMNVESAQARERAVHAQLAHQQADLIQLVTLLDQTRQAQVYAEKRAENDLVLLQLEVTRAEAELEMAQSQRQLLKIFAPQDGVVTWIPRMVREVVDHNDTILTVSDPQSVWVEAYFEGDVLAHLRPNQEAWIKIDGVTEGYLPGRVSVVYPPEKATERGIRVGPAQARTPAHLSHLTHPVKITFSEDIPTDIRPEMLATVRIARN
jgi:multidrug resistance efflux pump